MTTQDVELAAKEALATLQELKGPREAAAAVALVHAAIIGSQMPLKPQQIEAMIIDYVAGLRIAISLQAKQRH